MLAGQEIGLIEILMITAFGMLVSMAAMVILWVFVVILGKLVSWKESDNAAKPETVTVPVKPLQESDALTEEELAAIIALSYAESGLYPSQLKVTSITSSANASEEEIAAITAAICTHRQV